MDAPQYIALGATLVALVLLVAIVVVLVRAMRRRRYDIRDKDVSNRSVHDWLPPSTPAPLEQLASASLESRIAAWVTTAPQSGADVPVPASKHTEPVASLPIGPASLLPVDLAAAALQTEDACALESLDRSKMTGLTHTSVPDDPTALGESSNSRIGVRAPVELWIDGKRLLVDSGDETSAEFRRYANELLADLARTRKQ